MQYERFRQLVINRIKELASTKNLTINQLCKKSHVSNSTISKFLNDPRASITLDTLEKLCYGLEIEFSDFFNTPDFNRK